MSQPKDTRICWFKFNQWWLGYFHCWGIEKINDGSQTMGIVEDYNGKIFTLLPKHISFGKEPK